MSDINFKTGDWGHRSHELDSDDEISVELSAAGDDDPGLWIHDRRDYSHMAAVGAFGKETIEELIRVLQAALRLMG